MVIETVLHGPVQGTFTQGRATLVTFDSRNSFIEIYSRKSSVDRIRHIECQVFPLIPGRWDRFKIYLLTKISWKWIRLEEQPHLLLSIEDIRDHWLLSIEEIVELNRSHRLLRRLCCGMQVNIEMSAECIIDRYSRSPAFISDESEANSCMQSRAQMGGLLFYVNRRPLEKRFFNPWVEEEGNSVFKELEEVCTDSSFDFLANMLTLKKLKTESEIYDYLLTYSQTSIAGKTPFQAFNNMEKKHLRKKATMRNVLFLAVIQVAKILASKYSGWHSFEACFKELKQKVEHTITSCYAPSCLYFIPVADIISPLPGNPLLASSNSDVQILHCMIEEELDQGVLQQGDILESLQAMEMRIYEKLDDLIRISNEQAREYQTFLEGYQSDIDEIKEKIWKYLYHVRRNGMPTSQEEVTFLINRSDIISKYSSPELAERLDERFLFFLDNFHWSYFEIIFLKNESGKKSPMDVTSEYCIESARKIVMTTIADSIERKISHPDTILTYTKALFHLWKLKVKLIN